MDNPNAKKPDSQNMDPKASGPQISPPKDGGLYKNLNISLRQLNMAIVVLLALLVVMMFLGTRQSGYTISYNAKGGSDVASQSYDYGDTLTLPAPPTRQGYTFAGWSLDENGQDVLQEPYTIESSATLYALWTPETSKTSQAG